MESAGYVEPAWELIQKMSTLMFGGKKKINIKMLYATILPSTVVPSIDLNDPGRIRSESFMIALEYRGFMTNI